MTYASNYPIIAVTVDVIVLVDGHSLLLIRRGQEPFKGKLALPGGFVNPDETIVEAAARELAEETGLLLSADVLTLECVADAPDRDPRGRTISIVYKAEIDSVAHDFSQVVPADDAQAVLLMNMQDAEAFTRNGFAFDHWDILFEPS